MTVDDFIARWTDREGGAERANYVLFLSELCDLIGVARPEPAGATSLHNDYVFERAVRPRDSADIHAPKRIDLYKKDCFILEAKQSRLPGKRKDMTGPGSSQANLPLDEPAQLGRRGTGAKWDAMMRNARQQGEGYVFLLDKSQPAPPFVMVCDVGHCLELYADFSGTGRDYTHFPDRNGFRIYLEDLRKPEMRERLKAVWTDPRALDPTKHAARVTRDIARRLADVSKALELRGCNAEDVAHFLMRCLFTMFAEDVGLLPNESFKTLLAEARANPPIFARSLKALWKQMDEGEDYSFVIKARVKKFNGGLFKNTTAFELERQEIGELYEAALHDWKAVDPAIFGTLLEQALDKDERRKLGAHYTPRAYVRRLVDVTIMEPLRADWQAALTKVEQATDDGDDKRAIATVLAFHKQLCATRVLDPACGTGNFLYVALELMKILEGEVLEVLAKLGQTETLGLEEVDPHRFLGLEINPRAAAIAELVIWIGYLQQHYRTRTGHPSEPILKDFKNINFGLRGGYDAVLTWEGYPLPTYVEKDGKKVATYPKARRPAWPEAEFIVGNPPFLGVRQIKSALDAQYVTTLRNEYALVPYTADFVLYWWSRAADILQSGGIIRFGMILTNSVTQQYSRSLIKKYISSNISPLKIVFAVADHPWSVDQYSANVRVAMTVCASGQDSSPVRLGSLLGKTGDSLQVSTVSQISELLIEANDQALVLNSNRDICFQGVVPAGDGFKLTASEMTISQIETKATKPYLIGRDLVQQIEKRFIIDLFGYTEREARSRFPHAYSRLIERVAAERAQNNRKSYRDLWWLFAEPRPAMRRSLEGLNRYIGTPYTSKHRLFVFVDAVFLPDAMVYAVASSDASIIAVLSSKFHVSWSLALGGTLEDRPRYNKAVIFDTFAFPMPASSAKLSVAGDDLDLHRKRVLAEHPDLTLTGLYNVLEKLKAGTPLTPKDEDVKDRGLVLILRELHEEIDRLTAEAYGWPVDLSDDEILARLVALNAERAKEEAAGLVRWLRPEYQIPRFGKQVAAAQAAQTGELDLPEVVPVAVEAGLPPFPTNRDDHSHAVWNMLHTAGRPMTAAEIARGFKRGGKRVETRVTQVLGTLVRYGRVTSTGDRFAA